MARPKFTPKTASSLRRSLPHLILPFLDPPPLTRCIDEGGSMDVVFLDLVKAFNKVPHKRLIEKLQKHGIGRRLKVQC